MEETSIFDIGSGMFEGGLIYFLIRAGVSWLIAKMLIRLLDRVSNDVVSRHGKKAATSLKFTHNVMSAIIYAITVFTILAGITPLAKIGNTALGATSVLTVVVGLAAQETFGNFIAGFSLALTQPFQVGDLITLPEYTITGTVMEITSRHTVLRTFENSTLIIPNSVMNTAIIEDKAFDDSSYIKWMSVGIAYDSDVDLAKSIISDVVSRQPGFTDTRSEQEKLDGVPAVVVRLDEFEASDLLMKFKVVSNSIGESLTTCSNIRQELLKEFAKNNISIAFPTVTIDQPAKE